MSASVNKVILIGNLGKDPEVRYLPDGNPICTLSLATEKTWKTAQGEKKSRTDWHRLVCANGLAEICAKYLKKGASVYVEGEVVYRKWQDKSGEERFTTEIRMEAMRMLSGRPNSEDRQSEGNNPPQNNAARRNPPQSAPKSADWYDDDVPF